MTVFTSGWPVDAHPFGGDEAGGVTGYFGENGDGGIARREDLKGAGLIVRLRGIADVGALMRSISV